MRADDPSQHNVYTLEGRLFYQSTRALESFAFFQQPRFHPDRLLERNQRLISATFMMPLVECPIAMGVALKTLQKKLNDYVHEHNIDARGTTEVEPLALVDQYGDFVTGRDGRSLKPLFGKFAPHAHVVLCLSPDQQEAMRKAFLKLCPGKRAIYFPPVTNLRDRLFTYPLKGQSTYRGKPNKNGKRKYTQTKFSAKTFGDLSRYAQPLRIYRGKLTPVEPVQKVLVDKVVINDLITVTKRIHPDFADAHPPQRDYRCTKGGMVAHTISYENVDRRHCDEPISATVKHAKQHCAVIEHSPTASKQNVEQWGHSDQHDRSHTLYSKQFSTTGPPDTPLISRIMAKLKARERQT